MKKRKTAFRIFILLAIFCAGYAARHFGIFPALIRWIQNFGPWAPLVYGSAYVLAVVLCIPMPPLSFAGGILFDFWPAVAVSTLGTAAGSTAAFLIGRYFIRASVERRIERFARLEKMMGLVRRKGWKIVLLARLSPVFPFFIGNYAFGATRMSARQYFLASLVGSLPGTMVYSYSGFIAGDLAAASKHERTPWEWALIISGFVFTVLLSLYLKRHAAAELKQENTHTKHAAHHHPKSIHPKG